MSYLLLFSSLSTGEKLGVCSIATTVIVAFFIYKKEREVQEDIKSYVTKLSKVAWLPSHPVYAYNKNNIDKKEAYQRIFQNRLDQSTVFKIGYMEVNCLEEYKISYNRGALNPLFSWIKVGTIEKKPSCEELTEYLREECADNIDIIALEGESI